MRTFVAVVVGCGLALSAQAKVRHAQGKPAKAVVAKTEPKAAPEAKAPEKKADSQAQALAAKVQGFYDKTQDLTADVSQEYTLAAMKNVQRAQGTMQIKKPGMLRWDVAKPYPKQYVVDGSGGLVIYDGEDNDYIEKKDFSADTLSASVTFLWGKGNLTKEFDVSMATKPELGSTVLELVPKKSEGFKRLYFAVDAETGVVQKSVVVDTQDNENKLTFSNVKTNTGLDAARFKWTPPPGAKKQNPVTPLGGGKP